MDHRWPARRAATSPSQQTTLKTLEAEEEEDQGSTHCRLEEESAKSWFFLPNYFPPLINYSEFSRLEHVCPAVEPTPNLKMWGCIPRSTLSWYWSPKMYLKKIAALETERIGHST